MRKVKVVSGEADKQRKKPYVCEVCKKSFSKTNHLTAHRYCHTGEKPFHCLVCGFKFRSKTGLKRHESCHGSQEFKCSVCKVGFANETKLKYHMRIPGIHRNENGDCKNYPKLSNKKKALHVRLDSDQKVCETAADGNKEIAIEIDQCTDVATSKTSRPENLLNGQSKQNTSLQKDDSSFSNVDENVVTTLISGTRSKVLDEKNSKSDMCSRTPATKSKDKRYVCDLCNKSFSKTNHLREHRYCHTGDKPFACAVCGIAFRSNSKLKRHKLLDHGSQDYKCPVCKVGFASQIKLVFHQRKHDVTHEAHISKRNLKFQDVKIALKKTLENVKCTDINRGTMNQVLETPALEPSLISSDKLSSSTRVYRGVMDLQMGLKHLKLGVTSIENDTGDVNIQKPHSNTITVVQDTEIIAFPFSSNIEKRSVTVFVTHEKIVIDLHSPGKVDENLNSNQNETSGNGQCIESDSNINFPDSTTQAIMDLVTDNENFVEKSTEDINAGTPKPENSTCSSDGERRTNSKTETRKPGNHENSCTTTVWNDVMKHTKDGQVHYTCNKCDITCPDLASMRVHTRSQAHIRFSCDFCGKVYNCGHRSRYLRHIRTHTGERPYQCEICGKGFVCATGLRIHRITHTTERPHHCNICGKGFSDTGSLHEHERIHTGEKRNQCETCGKSFTHRATLRRHVSMHTGNFPFKCKECPKSFFAAFLLKQHMTTHTGEKAFKCHKCGNAFTSSSHLSRHKKTHCKAVHSSIPNNCERIKEEQESSILEPCTDSEQTAVTSIVVNIGSALSNVPLTGNERTVSLPLVQRDAETQSDDLICTTVPIPQIINIFANHLATGAEISVEEGVVLENSENPDNLYQCTGCLNAFMDLDTAVNHVCSEN